MMNYSHDMKNMRLDPPPPPPPPPPPALEDRSFYNTGASTIMNMDECSSGFQSASISSFPSSLPSSSSTTVNEYPPQPPPPCVLPPPPPDVAPSKVIEELGQYINNENDKVVLTSSVGILFSYSVNNTEVCRLMSESPVILNALYNLLTNEQFKGDDPILFLATGNLTNISKYEAGRAAILGCNGLQANEWPSRGVLSLINSLQSRDSNVVIFAITAVHNLLLDRRVELQEIAKKQIKHADGIGHIVRQLANQYLVNNYEFKVIVLDCLQILAYGNMENRITILRSGGPQLILKTMEENFDNQPTEELVETASRVLKSLSACPQNKVDIIQNNGIQTLTRCIKRDNQEILKTCLWTLRNLSDVIINSERDFISYINQLIERILTILCEYAEEPCIVTCALGILANLTCNNESIKQLICDYGGVELTLRTMSVALRDNHFPMVEILEPAVCTLCHLMNQAHYPRLEEERQRIRERFRYNSIFRTLTSIPTSEEARDLPKAVDKLISLLGER